MKYPKNTFLISFGITFNMPSLLGVDAKSLLFDKEAGTHKLNIAVQETWSFEMKDAPSWIRTDQHTGTGDHTEVFISVDENTDKKERQTLLQIYRIPSPQEDHWLAFSNHQKLSLPQLL